MANSFNFRGNNPFKESVQMSNMERYERRLETIKKLKVFTPKNRKLLSDFVETSRSKNITAQRIVFYLERLKRIAEFHKGDWDKWTRKDIEKVMRAVNEQGYKPWTIEAFKTTFKVFWRWMHKLDTSDPAPKIVSWLVRDSPKNGLRKEELLTREEINRMIAAEKSLEGKALLACLAAGPRPSELLSIRLCDITDEGNYIKCYVRGKMHRKTGERAIFIGFFIQGSDELIRNWIKFHPERDGNNKLFPGMYNERMINIVARAAREAKIKKKAWPYLFRHTYGTWAYGSYNSAHARRLMGHSAGSKMEGIYCHLNEDDIVNVLTGKVRKEEPVDIEGQDRFNKMWDKFMVERREQMRTDFFEWAKGQQET